MSRVWKAFLFLDRCPKTVLVNWLPAGHELIPFGIRSSTIAKDQEQKQKQWQGHGLPIPIKSRAQWPRTVNEDVQVRSRQPGYWQDALNLSPQAPGSVPPPPTQHQPSSDRWSLGKTASPTRPEPEPVNNRMEKRAAQRNATQPGPTVPLPAWLGLGTGP